MNRSDSTAGAGWFQDDPPPPASPVTYRRDTPGTYVALQTIRNLENFACTGTATTSSDTAVFSVGTGGALTTTGSDNILSLANYWNFVEFNIVGDCCGSGYNTLPRTRAEFQLRESDFGKRSRVNLCQLHRIHHRSAVLSTAAESSHWTRAVGNRHTGT